MPLCYSNSATQSCLRKDREDLLRQPLLPAFHDAARDERRSYFRPIFKSEGDRIRSTLTEAFGSGCHIRGVPNARLSWRRRRRRRRTAAAAAAAYNALMKMATRRDAMRQPRRGTYGRKLRCFVNLK